MEELKHFRQEGVTQSELDRAREQAKSNLLMSLESTSSRMNRLGSGVLHLGESMDPDDLIRRYDAITTEDILALAQRVLDFDEMSFSAVGRVSDIDVYREVLKRQQV
jgi:predicted Zn-dependent peptidase